MRVPGFEHHVEFPAVEVREQELAVGLVLWILVWIGAVARAHGEKHKHEGVIPMHPKTESGTIFIGNFQKEIVTGTGEEVLVEVDILDDKQSFIHSSSIITTPHF